jgi:hypothetical protein
LVDERRGPSKLSEGAHWMSYQVYPKYTKEMSRDLLKNNTIFLDHLGALFMKNYRQHDMQYCISIVAGLIPKIQG